MNMKKTTLFSIFITLVFVQCSAMAVSYFGTGSYVQNSPVKPNQGIDFYVQNSFMQTYSAVQRHPYLTGMMLVIQQKWTPL